MKVRSWCREVVSLGCYCHEGKTGRMIGRAVDRKDVTTSVTDIDRYRQTRIPLAYYNLWWSGVMIVCPCV